MLAVARSIVYRDLLLALRRRSDAATALLFFVIVASLFPLGVGAEPNQLRAIGPGVIWVAALLSTMLSLGRLFAADYADGTLEQLALGAAPLGGVRALGGRARRAHRARVAARLAVPRAPLHCRLVAGAGARRQAGLGFLR